MNVQNNNIPRGTFFFLPSKPMVCKIVTIGAKILLGAALGAVSGFCFGANPISIAIGATVGAIVGLAIGIFTSAKIAQVNPIISKETYINTAENLIDFIVLEDFNNFADTEGLFRLSAVKSEVDSLVNQLCVERKSPQEIGKAGPIAIANALSRIFGKIDLFGGQRRTDFLQATPETVEELFRSLTRSEQEVLVKYLGLIKLLLNHPYDQNGTKSNNRLNLEGFARMLAPGLSFTLTPTFADASLETKTAKLLIENFEKLREITLNDS